MTEALLMFSRMIAWSVLFLGAFAIVVNVYARVSASAIDELHMKLEGSHWRSPLPFFVVAALGAMWLYASWGTG